MKHNFDTIILGMGGIGAGAAYWLSRAGSDVLGIEQFEIGHVRGGSQDHSRIIRLSYHTPEYVELAKRAYQSWAELESDSGEKLIVRTGGIDLFPENGAIPMGDYTASMDAAAVPYEILNSHELMQRWPQFSITPGVTTIYQEQSGIAPAAKCNAAHIKMARAHGAVIIDNTPVTAIQQLGQGYAIEAGGEKYICANLVISAGAWTNNALAHLDHHLPLEVTQEQVSYYDSPQLQDFSPDRFPIWIWMDEPCFYGFPIYGEAGPKVAQDVGGRAVTADSRSFEPNLETTQRTDQFLSQVIPGILGPKIYTKTCLYTLTPDRDFVIDRLLDHPNVFVAVGAGHAFKFTSVIGRILGELVMEGRTASDISAFSFARPILHEANPEKKYMI